MTEPKPREALEREVKGLRDALDYAVEAAKHVKVALQMYVPPELQKHREIQLQIEIMDAISKETSMVGPLLSAASQRYAFERAVDLALDVARDGGEEWRAACEAVAARLRKLL